ncbi:MAG: hypothetical protein ABIW94_03265 [Gemmatimonadaceae bacterium]
MSSAAFGSALTRARRFSFSWAEVAPSTDVREQAIRLLRVHRLRAADAVHLAATIIASDFQASSLVFVTLDKNQAAAADKEELQVVS